MEIVTDNSAVIVALKKRIRELEKERDELKGKIENADLSSWKVFLKSNSKILQAHNLEQQAKICELLAETTYTDTANGQIEQFKLYQMARSLREQAKAIKDGD